jgi:hypothetical protein
MYKETKRLYKAAIKKSKKDWLSKTFEDLSNPLTFLSWTKPLTDSSHIIFSDEKDVPILDPDKNAAHVLQKPFPDNNLDNQSHIAIRKQMDAILNTSHSTPEPITIDEIHIAADLMKSKTVPR